MNRALFALESERPSFFPAACLASVRPLRWRPFRGDCGRGAESMRAELAAQAGSGVTTEAAATLKRDMAVYTEIGDDELRDFVALYDIGEVLSCKGIAEGVENSNFLLTTERGNFILTLYEKRVAPRDLPFFIGLMDHLAHQGVACPTPVRARDGEALRELCGRPAAIVTFLNGMWPRRIDPAHCAGLGAALARLHLAGGSFPMVRPNDLSVAGWRRLYQSCAD